MDDTEALQRTVRRVGAVLALLLAVPMNGGDYFQVGFVATVGALLYLVGSFALQFVDSVDPIDGDERDPEPEPERRVEN